MSVRYHAWLPLADPRCRCPAGHAFRPRATVRRGSHVVRCSHCGARVVVLVPRTGGMKLVAAVCEADLAAMAALDGEGEMVYLLTTPIPEPARAR